MKLKLSDVIADMILDMFDDDTPTIQIQRNDLAAQLGCVPSQINYVITSRFTPEQGYRIESRRGGGGCIMITRAATKENAIISLINSIGTDIDEKNAKAHIYNLNYQNLVSDKAANMMLAVTADSNFRELPPDLKNKIRASQLKQMLLAYIN
ncbi:MAG: CtsR family transcriptional regulator [Eubacterium sp.]